MHIRDVLTEFINMAQGVKDSGITVNANGKRILDGLEIAKKALVKLEENYFAQLSDEGIQTFLDKCKILARQFELEQSKKIQSLNVYKDGTCITIRARHKDYDAENRKLVLYKNNEDIIFECSELPGFFDGSKERDVVWGVEKMVNGVFQRVTNLNPPYAIGYLFKDRYTLRFPEDGIYKVTADFIEYTKGKGGMGKKNTKILDQEEINIFIYSKNNIKNNITFILARKRKSYLTVNNKKKELRGKDILTFINISTKETYSFPVSSVPTMKGTILSDTIAPGVLELTIGPKVGSEYSPFVVTISKGITLGGQVLSKEGTTIDNPVPWRGHDTDNWGSEGCFVGQRNNANGNWNKCIPLLFEWGLDYGNVIQGTLVEID